MSTPGEPPTSDNIYAALLSAVTAAELRRGHIGSIAAELRPALLYSTTALYLGQAEWTALTALLKKWGVEWSGGGTSYDPVLIEESRSEFRGVKIYRVDAASHLNAT